MLSGCDTSNDSVDNIKNKKILRSLEKNPGMQMARKSNFVGASTVTSNIGNSNNLSQN